MRPHAGITNELVDATLQSLTVNSDMFICRYHWRHTGHRRAKAVVFFPGSALQLY